MILSLIKKYKYQILLVGLVLLVLYPLSFFIYIPKWDNINGYLPYRYFISDYLWNGHLPLWNPFQNLGYPGYCDLQSGAWYPVVWVIMLFGKYTINSLIVELLSCYMFAGLGFFKLTNYFFKSQKTAFILGLSYALSGFMVGSSQLMVFLIAVTWFPWVIYYLLRFFENYKLKYKMLTAFFMALFITGASPAYTIVLTYIVVGIFIYQIVIQKNYKKILFGGTTVLIILIALILPYINSFIEFAPYFNRVDKLEYSQFLLSNPFTPVSYISFLFPFTVIADTDWFNITDLSLRNGYFGAIVFVVCISAFFSSWNRTKVILVIGVFVSLLLAAGGETFLFKYLYHLPGFGVFRHPSMFRVFTIFCCLLLAGYELKCVLENGVKTKHKIAFGTTLLLVIVGAVWAYNKTDVAAVKQLMKDVYHFGEFSNHLFSTHLLLNAVITFGLLVLIPLVKRFVSISWFWIITLFVLLDLGIQTRLTFPTTICYKIPHKEINDFFDRIPIEINQKDNYTPLKELDELQPLIKTDGIWQNVSTFNKTLSYKGINPLRFKSFDEAKEDARLSEAIQHNILYYEESQQQVEEIKIDYNKFVAQVNPSPKGRRLVLNQNYHHLWSAKLNGKELSIRKYKGLTMSVLIPNGLSGIIEFEYKSPRTTIAFVVSVLGFLLLVVTLSLYRV